MQMNLQICGKIIPVLVLILFAVTSFCNADNQKRVEVVGVGECADCHLKNIRNGDAFKGLKVTIDCKLANGGMKRRGEGKVDEEGKFQVSFPQELVENGKLKEECYAQLHSASNTPCPTFNGLDATKLAFVSELNGKHTFSPNGRLKFSPSTCTSAFLWPKKSFPKLNFPHIKWPNPHKFFPKKPFPVLHFSRNHSHMFPFTRSHSHHPCPYTQSLFPHLCLYTRNRSHHLCQYTRNRSHHQYLLLRNHALQFSRNRSHHQYLLLRSHALQFSRNRSHHQYLL